MTRRLASGEEVVLRLRPHGHLLLWPVLAAMGLAAAGGFAYAALASPWDRVAAGVAAGGWVVLGLRPVWRWWTTRYLLTDARVVLRRGLWARSAATLDLADVADVRVYQRLHKRLLRCGDVVLDRAPGRDPDDEDQLELTDVPDPFGFRSAVIVARELAGFGERPDGSGRDVVAQLEALADLRERGHLDDEEFAAHKRRLLDAGD